MLYALGPLTFEVLPFNTHEVTRESGFDFAAKDIIDAPRPREAMGERDEHVTFRCTLFPGRFGGLEALDTLDQMRASGEAQLLIRGDGLNQGWYVIIHVQEHASLLNAQGVGQQMEVSIELVKSPNMPSPDVLLGQLMSLFG